MAEPRPRGPVEQRSTYCYWRRGKQYFFLALPVEIWEGSPSDPLANTRASARALVKDVRARTSYILPAPAMAPALRFERLWSAPPRGPASGICPACSGSRAQRRPLSCCRSSSAALRLAPALAPVGGGCWPAPWGCAYPWPYAPSKPPPPPPRSLWPLWPLSCWRSRLAAWVQG